MYTPKPWINKGKRAATGSKICGGSPLRVVATVNDIPRGEGDANVCLIAAAPELLEALENAIAQAEFEGHAFRPWHGEAKSAIAKAKGE